MENSLISIKSDFYGDEYLIAIVSYNSLFTDIVELLVINHFNIIFDTNDLYIRLFSITDYSFNYSLVCSKYVNTRNEPYFDEGFVRVENQNGMGDYSIICSHIQSFVISTSKKFNLI